MTSSPVDAHLDGRLRGLGVADDVGQRLPDRGEDLRPHGAGTAVSSGPVQISVGPESERLGVLGDQGLDIRRASELSPGR